MSSAAASAGGLDASSLSFLRSYAATQRFRAGVPGSFAPSPDGRSVFFLRTADAEHAAQHLYALDVASGRERLLLRADQLPSLASGDGAPPASADGGDEQLSKEELQLRERQRRTSKGLSSFQLHEGSHALLLPLGKDLFLYDAPSGAARNLTRASPHEAAGAPCYPQFAPDGRSIALVRSGDLYIIELARAAGAAAGAVQSHREWRLTHSGSSVRAAWSNGVAEFAAQEELDRFRGFWWAPDSACILFQHTDESQVETLAIADLAAPSDAPTLARYPRPGKPNADVRLGIIPVRRPAAEDGPAGAGGDAQAAKKRKLDAQGHAAAGTSVEAAALTVEQLEPDVVWVSWPREALPYVCTVSWSHARAPLTLVVASREQTEVRVLAVDAHTGATRALLTETDDAWLNLKHSCPSWLSSGEHFLWWSDASGYATLSLHSKDGAKVRELHDGQAVQFRKLDSKDEAVGVVYLTGGPSATEQHLWRIPLGVDAEGFAATPGPTGAPVPAAAGARRFPGKPVRLTLTPAMHAGVFAPRHGLLLHESHSLRDGSHFVLRRLPTPDDVHAAAGSAAAAADQDAAGCGAIVAEIASMAARVPAEHLPHVELREVHASERLAFEEAARSHKLMDEHDASNAMLQALQPLAPKAADAPPEPQPAVFGTHSYNVALLRPRDFDARRKYPVVLYVYGGPGHRLVTQDRATYLLAQWVANQGYVVVVTDNRGTPARGRAWERAIKGDFQHKPLADQVAVLRQLEQEDSSLDLSQGVAIYGWSFGGYMSALAVMRYPSLFAAAFVGAPVCDWHDYDTAYTERYLGIPTTPEREADYARSSVLTYAPRCIRPLLLTHGYTDDNVFFAHAIKMQAALFRHGRQCEFLPLPGTHMLADPLVTMNLYARLAAFFAQHRPPAPKQ